MAFLHKLAQRLARMKTALIMGVVAAIACEVPLTDPASSVGHLQLAPKTSTLRTGQTAQFVAFALTPAGDTAVMSVHWSTTGGSIVDTSTTGGRHYLHYMSPNQPGQYEIITQSAIASLSDSAVVTVTAVPVASVTVSPASVSPTVGQTAQLTASMLDSTGAALSGRVVTWVSSNSGVATVSASGLVTGVAAGSAMMTATSEGKSGIAAVTVLPVPVASVSVTPGAVSPAIGQTAQLTATPRDASGNALTGRVVTWGSSNSAVATVSASGLVSGIAAGLATITATSEGKSGTAAITVTSTPVPVASVGVTPASASVSVGQTVQLTATPRDAGGNVLVGRVVTWASGNTGSATVSASGLVTGVAAGAVTITATSEGQSGSSAITVTAPVASVSVTPTPASVAAGQTVQLTATPRDASGNALTGRVVTWSSSNTGVATVNGSGLVTGVAVGTATITATSEGKNGGAAITVTPAPVASVSVSPAAVGVTVGLAVPLTATPRDANGTPLSGRVVTWASDNTAVATVNGSGLVTGVAVGTATITATSEGKSGSATITVMNPLSSDEPVFAPGTDAVLWSDNFDSYTSVGAMASGTVPNYTSAGNVLVSPGRSGTGKALRSDYSLAPTNQNGGQLQRSINWLSPWKVATAMSSYTPTTARIVVQFWFRFSAGGTPAGGGTKWTEYFVRSGTYRWQSGIDTYTGGGWNPYVTAPPAATQGEVFAFNNSGSPTDANGHVEQAQQPVGPWISDINDGSWHRWTALVQASSSPGAGDGMFRAWIDGTKIMDLSASAVGVTPPGGRKPWCYAGETVVIPADPIGYLQLPGVANNISGALYTLDHDDLVIWQQGN